MGPGPDRYPQQTAAESALDEIRLRYPGWVIEPVFGGFVAYPAGVTVVRSMFLEGLDEKLSQLDSGGG